MENLIESMKNKYPALSKGQKRIADFLINHYDEAVYLTAAKLGETTGVSESTVVRFAIELGYDGYPKLQKSLEELVKSRLTASQRIKVSTNRILKSDKHILKAVLESDAERIHSAINDVDEKVFDLVVEKMINAKKIFIVGGRSSAPLTQFFCTYLNMMVENVVGVTSTAATEIYESIFRISSDDIFIGISFPRYSQKTIRAMEYAKDRGATTIAITDSMQSPLTKNAALSLTARSDMLSFVDSLVAPLSLINAILVAVSTKKQDELIDTLDSLERLWNEYKVYMNESENKYI
ncbi:MAG: MurR/RpiR family transcriptional regulator [Firmicutes bacterium]|nr:MurR/RpiR family transcriptional regulator [Bacillota bacterium]